MGSLALLDLIAVVATVLAAATFLVWQLGFKKSAPACHPSRTKPRAQPGDVVVGASLARGLARARGKG